MSKIICPSFTISFPPDFEIYINSELTLTRVFYIGLDLGFNLNLKLDIKLDLDFYLDRYLRNNYNQYIYINKYHDLDINLYLTFCFFLDINQSIKLAKECNYGFYVALFKIHKKFPISPQYLKRDELLPWFKENGEAWTEDFRQAMIQHRNIGHDWQFNEAQKTLLKQYYHANQLLTQCLHQDCYVSPEVRQYIEETLLLPIAEIKPFEIKV